MNDCPSTILASCNVINPTLDTIPSVSRSNCSCLDLVFKFYHLSHIDDYSFFLSLLMISRGYWIYLCRFIFSHLVLTHEQPITIFLNIFHPNSQIRITFFILKWHTLHYLQYYDTFFIWCWIQYQYFSKSDVNRCEYFFQMVGNMRINLSNQLLTWLNRSIRQSLSIHCKCIET